MNTLELHSHMYDGTNRLVQNVQGVTTDYDVPFNGYKSHAPFRPAMYTQNWSGIRDWQTWSNLEFPPGYRARITRGNVSDTMHIIQVRNQYVPLGYAPIALRNYALNTQMVYGG